MVLRLEQRGLALSANVDKIDGALNARTQQINETLTERTREIAHVFTEGQNTITTNLAQQLEETKESLETKTMELSFTMAARVDEINQLSLPIRLTQQTT